MTISHANPGEPVRDRALDAFFESYYRLRPVNATFTGVHEYDHLLPDWSPDGVAGAVAEMHALRKLFRSGAPTRPESRESPSHRTSQPFEAIDDTLADAFLEIQIAEMDGGHFQRRNPSLHVGEGVFSIIGLMLDDEEESAARSAVRGEAVATRLRRLPQFLQAARSLIGAPLIPELWLTRSDRECMGAHQLFGNGLVQWCTSRTLPGALRRSIGDAATGALRAVREFQQWLSRCETGPTVVHGCGPDFFDLLLTSGHQLRVGRRDLLADARERFREARDRWDELALAADSGGWDRVQARLETTRPMLPEYVGAFKDAWTACRALADQHDLVTWPDLPVRYCLVPRWVCQAAPRLYFLNYRSPPPFDLPGVVSSFVPDMLPAGVAGRPFTTHGVSTHVIKLNHVAHHSGLGHHVQNAHAYRAESRIGQVAAVDCASRIGMFCGGTMAEGWACYATDVMEEVGFCTDLESVALQQTRTRHLARAIVDIELHQLTMSACEARRFLIDQARMDAESADRELTRISMFPGTGLMYWVGTEAIHRVRAQREAQDGPQFSLRAFHDELLSFGSIPVAMIADQMTSLGVR